MANVVAVAIVIAVTTSVQVSKKTLQLLQRLKKELGAKSHDQVIRDLIANRKRIPRPMLGCNPKLRPVSVREETESHGLWLRNRHVRLDRLLPRASPTGGRSAAFIEGERSATP